MSRGLNPCPERTCIGIFQHLLRIVDNIEKAGILGENRTTRNTSGNAKPPATAANELANLQSLQLPLPNPESLPCATPNTPPAAASGGSTASKTSPPPSRWSARRAATRRPRRAGRLPRPLAAAGRRSTAGGRPREIAAVVELLDDRVKYGLHDRLRKLLLPLVTAVEKQMEARRMTAKDRTDPTDPSD